MASTVASIGFPSITGTMGLKGGTPSKFFMRNHDYVQYKAKLEVTINV